MENVLPRKRVLFVTWDGPQVQYLENLFLPIFGGLAAHGFDFDILQFRWGDPAGIERARSACERHGIGYHSRQILRCGGSAGAMITALAGTRVLAQTVRTCSSAVVIVRSIMPAVMALCARELDAATVFDSDGLAIDERAEFGGLSTTGATYRILREIEAQMVRKADVTLNRTEAGANILRARAGPGLPDRSMQVAPNGSDTARFAPLPARERAVKRAELGISPTAPLLIYVGSIGPQYRLSESLSLLSELRRSHGDARLLILTGSPEFAAREVAAAGQEKGIDIRSCAPDEVARWIAAADFGTAYRQAGYSMAGVSPVKIGEYLLCGTPVVGTAAVGANAAALAAGVFIDEAPGPAALAQQIAALLADPERYAALRHGARQNGLANHSLERCVEGYAEALRQALRRHSERGAGR